MNKTQTKEYRRLLCNLSIYQGRANYIKEWSDYHFYHPTYESLAYWARRDIEAFEQKIKWG